MTKEEKIYKLIQLIYSSNKILGEYLYNKVKDTYGFSKLPSIIFVENPLATEVFALWYVVNNSELNNLCGKEVLSKVSNLKLLEEVLALNIEVSKYLKVFEVTEPVAEVKVEKKVEAAPVSDDLDFGLFL